MGEYVKRRQKSQRQNFKNMTPPSMITAASDHVMPCVPSTNAVIDSRITDIESIIINNDTVKIPTGSKRVLPTGYFLWSC
mmetsp:Transcript_6222/g.9864  ORF Transcript_6222/g.9864 Transcript_6222/m.9864 type:complete len:80 (-) Transcript_6222:527-766(-)